MASGKLGSASLAATTNTTLYTCPASTVTAATVLVCNTNAASVTVRIGVGTGASPAAGDYVEYDSTIPAYGVLERGALVLTAGEKIFVYASTTGVNVRANGYEEAV